MIKTSRIKACLIFLFTTAPFLLAACSENPEEKAKREAQKAEDKRKGFHCLSPWDGSHSAYVRKLKENLRDPSSFEHIETKVTSLKDDGNHIIIVKYRAKNGFGGMNIETSFGSYRNSDCEPTIVSAS